MFLGGEIESLCVFVLSAENSHTLNFSVRPFFKNFFNLYVNLEIQIRALN